MCRWVYATIRVCLLTCIFSGPVRKAGGQTALVDSIINPTALYETLKVLASDSLQGRFTGTEHAMKAATFIAEEFRKAGALPVAGNEGYLQLFAARHPSAKTGINVLAAIPGNSKADEVIIFCAHYDHVGTASTNPYPIKAGKKFEENDTIFNGANDNASGVSAVVRLAHYFGSLKNNERTILFITFSGEELGLLGSQATAQLLDPAIVKAVINIEMIGRAVSKKTRNAYITGPHFSDIQKILNKTLAKTSGQFGKKFFYNDPFPDDRLFYRSDNYWFAKGGIPAHTIMASSPQDIYYHSPGDEISTLDFDLMSHLVRAIAIGCSGLIAGTDTPSRIRPHHIEDR